MGVREVKTRIYECDVCRQEVGEADVFGGVSDTLWSDRDVSAVAYTTIKLEISYASTPTACCKRCAAGILRAAADKIGQ